MGTRILTLALAAAAALATPALAAAQEGAPAANEFMKCARIASDARRLACYDRLATDLIELGMRNMGAPPAEAAAAAPAPAAAPTSAPAPVAARQPEPAPAPAPAAAVAEPAPAPAAPAAAAPAPAPAPATTVAASTSPRQDEAGFGSERQEIPAEDVKSITSRIDGEFTGWSGETVFPLENGQVWQQIQSGRMSWRADRPEVTIKRGMFGSYMLRVKGVNKSVRVRRIE